MSAVFTTTCSRFTAAQNPAAMSRRKDGAAVIKSKPSNWMLEYKSGIVSQPADPARSSSRNWGKLCDRALLSSGGVQAA